MPLRTRRRSVSRPSRRGRLSTTITRNARPFLAWASHRVRFTREELMGTSQELPRPITPGSHSTLILMSAAPSRTLLP